jgi:hypothetical protein
MLRIFIVLIGTYAILNTDLGSENPFESTVYPIINVFYLLFLLKEFLSFLYALSAHGTKGKDVNIADLMFDVWTLLYQEIEDKYSGRFESFGRFSDFLEDFVVPLEIILVIVSFYGELQLLAYLAK